MINDTNTVKLACGAYFTYMPSNRSWPAVFSGTPEWWRSELRDIEMAAHRQAYDHMQARASL